MSTVKAIKRGRGSGLGIIVTDDGARAICLQRIEGMLKTRRFVSFNKETDGILNTEELLRAVQDWMFENSLCRVKACAALPVMSYNEVIRSLPTTSRDSELESMVQLHARTLGSVAEEKFIYDFRSLRTVNDDHQHVLICIARENAVEEHFDKLSGLGIRLDKMSSYTAGLFNAFKTLYAGEADGEAAQLLLNLEDDFTDLAIVSGGNLLYESQLSFNCSEFEKSPEVAAEHFKSELLGVVGHWRESLPENSGEIALGRLWLAGNRARDFLSKGKNACDGFDAILLGVSGDYLEEGGDASVIYPEYAVPFGLALQSLEEGRLNLSLAPELVKWQHRKEREFPYLAATVGCVCMSLLVALICVGRYLQNEVNKATMRYDELSVCSEMIPKLDKAHRKIEDNQRKMIPLIDIDSRGRSFRQALIEWQNSQDAYEESGRSWGVYFGDELSFRRVNTENSGADEQKKVDEAAEAKEEKTVDKTGDMFVKTEGTDEKTTMFAADGQTSETGTPSFKIRLIPVDKLLPLRSIYIGGLAPVPADATKYTVVKELQAKLIESGEYKNVDDFIDPLKQNFKDVYFTPWLEFLKNNKEALGGQEYTMFFLELPIKHEIIKFPETVEKKDRRSGRNRR